jgi:hypothetical protein
MPREDGSEEAMARETMERIAPRLHAVEAPTQRLMRQDGVWRAAAFNSVSRSDAVTIAIV